MPREVNVRCLNCDVKCRMMNINIPQTTYICCRLHSKLFPSIWLPNAANHLTETILITDTRQLTQPETPSKHTRHPRSSLTGCCCGGGCWRAGTGAGAGAAAGGAGAGG